jgi:lipopolysaccharide export system permease protein
MKKLIFTHFLKDILFFFLLMSLSLSLIVWVIQAVNYLDFITEDGHSFRVYFSYTLFNFPKIIHRILPFVFFVSLFYQINKYELKNELIIFWSTGISRFQFTKIIMGFSLFFLIFQVVIGAYLSPNSQDKARNFIRNSNIDFFPSLFQEGKFIDVVKNLTIFIETEKPKGVYNNIFLKEDGAKSRVIYANKGFIKNLGNKKYLELSNGSIVNIGEDKKNSFTFDSIDFDLTQYGSKSTSYPKIQELTSRLLIKCFDYYKQDKLNQFKSEILTCSKDVITNIKQELFKRFYKPIYLLLLSSIACLILFISKENKKFTFYKYIIFFIGIMAIVISEISLRYSSYNIFGQYFFITFPVFSILGFNLFAYIRSQKNY